MTVLAALGRDLGLNFDEPLVGHIYPRRSVAALCGWEGSRAPAPPEAEKCPECLRRWRTGRAPG